MEKFQCLMAATPLHLIPSLSLPTELSHLADRHRFDTSNHLEFVYSQDLMP